MNTTTPQTSTTTPPKVMRFKSAQKVGVFHGTGLRHGGAVTVELPMDADVVHVEPGINHEILNVYATVNVDQFGQTSATTEARIFWIAFTGDQLPSEQYPKETFEKTYVRSMTVQMSAVADVPTLVHVWQIRER